MTIPEKLGKVKTIPKNYRDVYFILGGRRFVHGGGGNVKTLGKSREKPGQFVEKSCKTTVHKPWKTMEHRGIPFGSVRVLRCGFSGFVRRIRQRRLRKYIQRRTPHPHPPIPTMSVFHGFPRLITNFPRFFFAFFSVDISRKIKNIEF